jgi:hypothetical protein
MFCDLNFCDPVFVVSFSAIFTEVRIYVSTTYRVRVVYMFTLVPRVLRFNSPVFVLPFLKPFYAVPLSIGPKNKHVLFGTKMIALLLGSLVFCIVNAKHVDLLKGSRNLCL